MSFADVSSIALELHEQMMEGAKGETNKMYTQLELQKYCKDSEKLMNYLNELINSNLVKLSQRGNDLVFEPVSHQNAARVKDMSGDEAMVYQCIENTGREGIWTKSIKLKTQLHQTVVLRCIKSLEGQRLIKSVKSVKNPTRKIYMLYHLEPSAEVTGGPWFTDSEMDSDFIDGLLFAVWKYVCDKSFPISDDSNMDPSTEQASYPANSSAYPTVTDIHDFIESIEIVQQDTRLGVSDIRHLCEVLVYDDLLERREMGHKYKATWQGFIKGMGADQPSVTTQFLSDGFTDTPCGNCPAFSVCEDQGPVNSKDCMYLDEWLVS